MELLENLTVDASGVTGNEDRHGRLRARSAPSRTHRFPSFTRIATGVLLLAGLDTVLGYWTHRAQGHPRTWTEILAEVPTFWLPYILLVPLTVTMARYFRLEPSRRTRTALAAHIAAASCFGLIHLAGVAASRVWLGMGLGIASQGPLWPRMARMLGIWYWLDFLLYWFIVVGFYAVQFYRESVARAIAAARLRVDLKDAQLQALRAELTPHFLFNTLNCMATLAVSGDRKLLRRMIINLSDLLRFSLSDRCPPEIPLARELELLDQYVSLQRLHAGERLRVECDIAPGTTEALVPSLILQPIVENAIVHGLAAVNDVQWIRIRSTREHEMLYLSVTDTGPGFAAADVRIGKGIGLTHTAERLRRLYGVHQPIRYTNAPLRGAVVTLSLPFHEAPWTVVADALDEAGQ